ncbi:hypothetical protein NM27_2156 [Neisseria meningitidis NM27]|nr:hypothetical protein NM27_2156 [Neisseria meningitidis NM27]
MITDLNKNASRRHSRAGGNLSLEFSGMPRRLQKSQISGFPLGQE